MIKRKFIHPTQLLFFLFRQHIDHAFKKDFIKEKHTHIINEKYTRTRKGSLVYLLPNYFNFVTPKDLISIDEVPDYAGLIYMNEDSSFTIVKKPKLLHKTKANEAFIRQVAHNLSCKLIFKKIS